MTAAVYRSGTPSLSVPPTQNSAPVLEFNCLYTHDLKRKQKRWQDGFLRFHTFNRRIMLYDVPRNFIGDAHWKADEALQDGDEVMLEKDGVMVQVAECVGKTETDLSELRKSKKKNSSEKGSSSPVRPGQTPARVANKAGSKSTAQLKHRSLNALLGTPKGAIGKAQVPTKSPFETRHADPENRCREDGNPPKRRRVEDSPARNITRAMRAGGTAQEKETPLWARTVDSAKQTRKVPQPVGQQRLATKEIVDLSEEVDDGNRFLPGFSSDALAPVSSPKIPAADDQTEKQLLVRSSSPAVQTLRFRTDNRKGSKRCPDEGKHESVLDLPPNAERISNKQLAAESNSKSDKRTEPGADENPVLQTKRKTAVAPEPSSVLRSQHGKAGQILRISASAPKKKTLLCQDLISKKPSRVHSENTESAIDALLDVASQHRTHAEGSKSQRKQLQDRLARISKKIGGDVVNDSRQWMLKEADVSPGQDATLDFLHTRNITTVTGNRPHTPLEQHALELAKLDQMIMPRERSRSPDTEHPLREDRQLRRVVSESNKTSSKPKRVPGAPVRFTPSPAKKSPSAASPLGQGERAASPLRPTTALPSKSRARRTMQRTVSLNTTCNGTSTVILSKPFQAPKPPVPKATPAEQIANPWSREALDLFTWRPPGWDEERWCLNDTPND